MANRDRLTALDAAFLHLERATGRTCTSPSCMIFEGEPPAYDELVEAIEARLHLVPRYRQRLAHVPFGQGRPVWVDDPHFNARYHVRHTRAAAPGLRRAAEATSPAACSPSSWTATRPLWELWLVEGLEGDRFAIIWPRPTTRSSTASPASTSRPCCSTSRPSRRRPRRPSARGCRGRCRATPSCWPRRWSSARPCRPRSSRGLRAVMRAPRQVLAQAGRRSRPSARWRWPGLNPRRRVAAQRADRPHRRFTWVDSEARALQGDQERARRDGQRRRARAVVAGARALAARPRHRDRRAHAQGDGPGLRARRHRARRARQPRRRDVGAAAGAA